MLAPVNFAYVEPGIFRCGLPEPKHYRFLEELNLRTCVLLTVEPADPSFDGWMRARGVKLVQLPSVTLGNGTSLTERATSELLSILLGVEAYHPVLVTCYMGRYRTGALVGCLRKLRMWTMASILEEYRRFAGVKSRLENEEFIELYDIGLVVASSPSTVPPTRPYHAGEVGAGVEAE